MKLTKYHFVPTIFLLLLALGIFAILFNSSITGFFAAVSVNNIDALPVFYDNQTIDFNFITTSHNISYCALFLNYDLADFQITASKTFILSNLSEGDYDWLIACTNKTDVEIAAAGAFKVLASNQQQENQTIGNQTNQTEDQNQTSDQQNNQTNQTENQNKTNNNQTNQTENQNQTNNNQTNQTQENQNQTSDQQNNQINQIENQKSEETKKDSNKDKESGNKDKEINNNTDDSNKDKEINKRHLTGLFLASGAPETLKDNKKQNNELSKTTSEFNLTKIAKKVFFVGQNIKYDFSDSSLSKNFVFVVLTLDKKIKYINVSSGILVIEENATTKGKYTLFIFDKKIKYRFGKYSFEKIYNQEINVINPTKLLDSGMVSRISSFLVNESGVLLKFNDSDALFDTFEIFDVLDLQQPIRVKEIESSPTPRFQRMYAIDPTGANFLSAKLRVKNATTSQLYKCADWNFTTQTCEGKWAFLKSITPGEDYTIVLTPDDPGYGESDPNTGTAYDIDGNDVTTNVSASDNVYASKSFLDVVPEYWVNSTINTSNACIDYTNFTCEFKQNSTDSLPGDVYQDVWNGNTWVEVCHAETTTLPTSDKNYTCNITNYINTTGNTIVRCRATATIAATANFFFDYLGVVLTLNSPSVEIQLPQNTTYCTTNISLNYTISPSHLGCQYCNYSLNGGSPVSLPNCANTTISVANGSHYIIINVTDDSGQKNSSEKIYFTTIDDATYSVPVFVNTTPLDGDTV